MGLFFSGMDWETGQDQGDNEAPAAGRHRPEGRPEDTERVGAGGSGSVRAAKVEVTDDVRVRNVHRNKSIRY